MSEYCLGHATVNDTVSRKAKQEFQIRQKEREKEKKKEKKRKEMCILIVDY